METFSINVDNKPFAVTADPSLLWLSERQREVFATLRYGIHDRKGFLLLTGVAGSGKTTLIKALTRSLEKDVEWAILSDPELTRIEFYNTIARGFGLDKSFTSKVQFLLQFSHFLHKADDENRKVLLVIDDCHRMSQKMLDELRLLSNIEKADTKLINICFVGRPEFNETLGLPNNRAVRQRLTLTVEAPLLSVDEVGEYIRHRLKTGGLEEKPFTTKAAQAVYRHSGGVFRKIDAICGHALASGLARTKKTINHKVIESCIGKEDLPAPFNQVKPPAFADEQADFDRDRKKMFPDLPDPVSRLVD